MGKKAVAAAEAGIRGNRGGVSGPSRQRFWSRARAGGCRARSAAPPPLPLHPFRATERVVGTKRLGSTFLPELEGCAGAARLPALFFQQLQGATGGGWRRGGRMARILATRRERDRWLFLGFGEAGARAPLLCVGHGGRSTMRCCDCERE